MRYLVITELHKNIPNTSEGVMTLAKSESLYVGSVVCPAGGTCARKSSSQIRKSLPRLFPAARAEKLSQAGRGSYIKSVSAQLALCLVSGMEDPLSFYKQLKLSFLTWRRLFPLPSSLLLVSSLLTVFKTSHF